MGIFDFLGGDKVTRLPLVEGAIKPVMLLILDGYGIAPMSEGNAIARAKKPNLDRLFASYPHGELVASGESVGLPANEVGNTEVGHLNMGAGRTMLQDLKRIDKAIEQNEFDDNRAFVHTLGHIAKTGGKLHLMGMLSTGRVHSAANHFWALIDFCRKRGVSKVYLHLFTDGRDAPPEEGAKLLEEAETKLKNLGIGEIASVAGRYYAMDRDKRWERTEKAYKAIVLGEGETATSASEAVKANYAKQITDEFVPPTVILKEGKPVATIDDNDGVIFFNYRIDRPRQLTMALVMPDFEQLHSFKFGYVNDIEKAEGEVRIKQTFVRGKVPKNIFMVTMTQYQERMPVSEIAFPPEQVEKSLAVVLAANNLRQMHMSESEKERFVTYYFDGLREERQIGEETDIVPSPKVATYDKRPQMSVFGLVSKLYEVLAKDTYHFIVMNMANPDMVAHTGNLKASIKAVEYTDRAVGEVAEMILKKNGTLLITADHGNAEELLTYEQGSFYVTSGKGVKNTDHSNNLVPLLAINRLWQGKNILLPQGTLADVAPTVLGLMGLPKPEVMTGRNLFS